jgi:hypothetical protein
MDMFEEDAANPLGDRKEKHVVAERRRPIRDGQPNAFARHHSPAANQEKRRNDRKHRETMQPRSIAGD